MFSGIIEGKALIRKVVKNAGGMRLVVTSREISQDTKIGDSISVNGVCLTVAGVTHAPVPLGGTARGFAPRNPEKKEAAARRRWSFTNEILQFDIMDETLSATTLSEIAAGDEVNVERSLKAGERLSGHFVTGHIDCIGVVAAVIKKFDNYTIEIRIPDGKTPYVVDKGSVAVDGISLTVVSTKNRWFKAAIIPTTFKITSLCSKRLGDRVNIEFDILAKYALRNCGHAVNRIDSEFLRRHGFA